MITHTTFIALFLFFSPLCNSFDICNFLSCFVWRRTRNILIAMEVMRASSVVNSNTSGLLSFQTQKKKVGLRKKYMESCIKARYGDYDCSEGPSLVDANISNLRRRVYELKLQESCHTPPQKWMEWEENIRSDYYSTISQATGILQWCLMSTRPSVALAALSLVLMGVGTSLTVDLLMAWSNVDMFLHNLWYWVSFCECVYGI